MTTIILTALSSVGESVIRLYDAGKLGLGKSLKLHAHGFRDIKRRFCSEKPLMHETSFRVIGRNRASFYANFSEWKKRALIEFELSFSVEGAEKGKDYDIIIKGDFDA